MNTHEIAFETEDREERWSDRTRKSHSAPAPCSAIFFGLVLVCGVFFGFGYSMGSALL